MKLSRSLLRMALLCQFCLFSASADEPKELSQLRFEFQVQLAELNTPLKELNGKYRGHLEKQRTAYQKAGNIRAIVDVDAELENYETAPGEKLSAFPELKRLQEIYREQRKALVDKASTEQLALMGAYGKKAEKLSIAWTKEGKLEEAKLAAAEADRFAAMEKNAVSLMKAGETVAAGSAAGNAANFEGSKVGDEMKNSLRMELCWLPAGKFVMGSPENEPEREAHKEGQVEVELTRGFWLGKYEVTQEEYEEVMGTNPAEWKEAGKHAPVEQVSWEEAMAFCKVLTERERKGEKLPEGWAYTLPTEAQWEYACRAGETGPISGGDLEEVAWYKDNSRGKTHEVGKKKANARGLHDMHGNVWEWCLDRMTNTLAGGIDPEGPASGSHRVHRGGSWRNEARHCRAAHRNPNPPSIRNSNLGFRVCLRSTQ